MQAYGVISRILLRCLAGRRKAGRKALYELIKKYDSTFFLSGFPVIYSIEGFSLAVLCKYLLRAAVDIMLFPESAVKGFLDIKKDNQEAINLIYTVLYKGRDLIFSLSRDAYSILYELILQRVELTEKGSAEYFWQLLADMEKEQVKLPADADALKGFIAEPNFPCYFTGILPFRQLSFLKK